MGCKGVNSWTLAGLVVAFLDLSIAYFMLCVTALVFFPSKVLSFFELFIPCPCSGFLGYQNSNLCLQKLLFHWPVRKIYSVMELVKSRLPFDAIFFEDQTCGSVVEGARDGKCRNGQVDLDGEGCSSAFSSPRLYISVDREGEFDSKGKKIVSQKQKSATRRRKRASLAYGKAAPVLPSNVPGSVGIGVTQPSRSDMRREDSERLGAVKGVEDDFQDNENAQNGVGLAERIQHNFQLDGSDWKSKDTIGDSSSKCNAEDRTDNVANDSNTIKMLERLLEEEKSARASLYQELEEERAAAASAADEALAMILRLQEDRAVVEMEARQYQRMIDEKFTYDEEEMSILKEILVRRETEIHFLEKEVEAYREINFSDNDQLMDELGSEVKSNEPLPSLSIISDAKVSQMKNQFEKSKTICEKEAPRAENCSSNYEHGHIPALEKETTVKHSEEVSHLSTPIKSIDFTENENASRDIGTMPQVGKMKQNFGEELEKNDGCLNEGDEKRHSSMPDSESTVYDVHVIDDKSIIWKEEDTKESAPVSTTASRSDSPSTSTEEILGNEQYKTLSVDLRSNSLSVEYERMKIDSEIEWLREKLRIVQEGKEKLTFSADRREMENARLKLVEEIVEQLKEIQQLREPARRASLPPLSSKVNLKKRRCRSMSLDASDSF